MARWLRVLESRECDYFIHRFDFNLNFEGYVIQKVLTFHTSYFDAMECAKIEKLANSIANIMSILRN